MKRIGLLGGSFNPVHNDHLLLAEFVKQRLQLDRVFLIPNSAPPHKNTVQVSYRHRLRMLRLALEGHPGLDISEIESCPEHPHYTFDTLTLLRHHYGADTALFFIMGMDSFLALDTWYRGLELSSLASLAVIMRKGYEHARISPAVAAYMHTHCVYEAPLQQGASPAPASAEIPFAAPGDIPVPPADIPAAPAELPFDAAMRLPAGECLMLKTSLHLLSSTRLRTRLQALTRSLRADGRSTGSSVPETSSSRPPGPDRSTAAPAAPPGTAAPHGVRKERGGSSFLALVHELLKHEPFIAASMPENVVAYALREQLYK